MRRTSLLHGVALLLLSAGPVLAQDTGGIGFPASGIASANLAQAFAQPARQPVYASATRRGAPPGAMVTNPGKSRKELHQQMIAKVRGDAGFLAGFQQGQPLAASRNPPPLAQPSLTFIDAPFIVNNINSALNIAFGEGNSTGQDVATNNGGEVLAGEGSGDVAVGDAPSQAAVSAAPAEPAGSRHRRHRSEPAPPQVAASPTTEPTKGPKTPSLPKAPEVPAMPAAPSVPAGQPDALMTTLGPLPYLPFAMKSGGVQFNNANSAVNIAAGVGNVAGQRVKTIQR